ncbi:hypothetical protein MMPV_003096 [Pyropia vietnamensis]
MEPPVVPPGVPPTSTVIVGGGPVGLTVALGLVARGWREVTVVERAASLVAPDDLRTYAMGISHRGQDVLVGVEAAMAAAASADCRGSVSCGKDGGCEADSCGGRPPLARGGGALASAGVELVAALCRHAHVASPVGFRAVDYTKAGGGYARHLYLAADPRSAAVLVLAAGVEAAGVRVLLGTSVVGVSWGLEEGGVEKGGRLPMGVLLAPTEGGGEQQMLRTGLLLGCDGCSSVVRGALGGAAAATALAVESEPVETGGQADGWPFSAACRWSPSAGNAPPDCRATRRGVRFSTGGVRVEMPSGFGASCYSYRTQGWLYKAIPLPVGHPLLGLPPPLSAGKGHPPAESAIYSRSSASALLPDVVTASGATWAGGAPRLRRRRFNMLAFRTGDDDAGRMPLATVLAPPDNDLWAVRSTVELRDLFDENFPAAPGEGGRSLLPDDEVAAGVVAAPPGVLPRMVVPHSLVAAVEGAPQAEGGGGVIGGVVLLGDAAHPVPPDLGQGVNSGLEDVGALLAALDKAAIPIQRGVNSGRGGGTLNSPRGGRPPLTPLHAALAAYAVARSAEAAALCTLSARANGRAYAVAAPWDGFIGWAVGWARTATSKALLQLHVAAWLLTQRWGEVIPPPVMLCLYRGDPYTSIVTAQDTAMRRVGWGILVGGSCVTAAVLAGWIWK